VQHEARHSKEIRLEMGDSQARANPSNELIIIRNEQISDLSLLEWMYCNRTATGLIRTSTQWTNLRPRSTETRINKLKTGHSRIA
jgi:hypothetical protein